MHKNDGCKTSIILPTLNEGENIFRLVSDLEYFLKPFEIIIVDDNSGDKTADHAKLLNRKYRNIKFISNYKPLGLTPSIQKGINLAKGEYIAWMDADFSHPPKTLLKMLKKMDSADIVVGSWLAKNGRDERNEVFSKFFSLLINRICTFLFDRKITAYTSGFIICRKEIFNHLKLKGDYGEYCIDFLVRASFLKFRIKEVAFRCISRSKGVSKTSPNSKVFIKRGLRYLEMIISLFPFILKK